MIKSDVLVVKTGTVPVNKNPPTFVVVVMMGK